MIALPVPLIVSFVTLYLLVQTMMRGAVPLLFKALLIACALQGVLISLVHYYEWRGLMLVLPITASAIPVLAWLAFVGSLIRPLRYPYDLLYAILPVLTAFCVWVLPGVLDLLIPLVFAGSGALIFYALRKSKGDMPFARLESGPIPLMIWYAIAGALIASAISDILIAIAIYAGYFQFRSLIVSTFSSCSLLAIAILGLKGEKRIETVHEGPPQKQAVSLQDDSELMARLEQLFQKEKLYLDADLTLAKLSRRLLVPAKELSATINRQTGENVSRFVNAHRINHACRLLDEGKQVTATIYLSGFNTKSNFNREFRRIKSCSPKEWIEHNG